MMLSDAWRTARKDEAFRNLGLKLVYAGSNQLDKEELTPLTDDSDNTIEVLGSVSDEQLRWLYEQCEFTTYPSSSEGWGFPVTESLSFGKLCIASNNVPSAMETSSAGIVLISPNDMFSWAETIKELAENAYARNMTQYLNLNDVMTDWGKTIESIRYPGKH
jgi:glycosyltransferase involved in cell wall biosynthesis